MDNFEDMAPIIYTPTVGWASTCIIYFFVVQGVFFGRAESNGLCAGHWCQGLESIWAFMFLVARDKKNKIFFVATPIFLLFFLPD